MDPTTTSFWVGAVFACAGAGVIFWAFWCILHGEEQ